MFHKIAAEMNEFRVYDMQCIEYKQAQAHSIKLQRVMSKHQICGRNMAQNCLKPTAPSRSTGVQTHGWCHSVGNQIVKVTKPIETGNRNTNNIKIAVKNAKIYVIYTAFTTN